MGIDRTQVYGSAALAGRVERYHTWPTLRRQTNAEHSWRVAAIYCEIFGLPRAEVLYYIMHHDSGELRAGDLPYRSDTKPEVKVMMREAEQIGRTMIGVELPQLGPDETVKVKICDQLESWEFGLLEMLQGNQLAEPIVLAMETAAMKMANEHMLLTMTDRWLQKQCKHWRIHDAGI